MNRTLVMTALLSALSVGPALAQSDTATDATTPMDRAAGNLDVEKDKTLSNAEVRRLQAGQMAEPPMAAVPGGETITPAMPRTTTSASGVTTTTHEERMDITAPEGGGPDH